MQSPRHIVSVGIAAYNAENNIGALLRAVSLQSQEVVTIVEIIVHSDQSTDSTARIARQCPDPRLVIIDNPHRKGFAASVCTMLQIFRGDAFVILNDDIQIRDDRFIEKAVLPVFRDRAGLVGANLQPLEARTFVEKAFVSTFRVYERIRESLPDRNNPFTCDGAAFSLSSPFARAIEFPSDPARMGNLDAFLYFSCVRSGFTYIHASEAVAYFRSPATLRDYLRRNIRNDSQEHILEDRFGSRTRGSLRPPRRLYWKSVAVEVLKNPLTARVGTAFSARTEH